MLESCVTVFAAQTAQLDLVGSQGSENLFLPLLEGFILDLAGAGGVDDLVGIGGGLNDEAQVLRILVLCLMQSKVIEGGEQVHDGDRTIAKTGAVVQAKLGGGVEFHARCLRGCQHDDGQRRAILIPELPKQVTLIAVVREGGDSSEGSGDGVRGSILQFKFDGYSGDFQGQVDHKAKVVIHDVQRRYEASPADVGSPLRGVDVGVDDLIEPGKIIQSLSDQRITAAFMVVTIRAVLGIENDHACQDFQPQLLRQMRGEQGCVGMISIIAVDLQKD